MIHSIDLKIRVKADGLSVDDCLLAVANYIKNYEWTECSVKSQEHLETVKRALVSDYGEDHVSFRDGCLQGCYGSNTGRHDDGITVSLDVELFPERVERFEDLGEDKPTWCEYYNPVALLTEYGQLMEDLDADSFLDACEGLGHDIKRDNTYNFAEHGESETVEPMYTVDFSIVEGPEACFVVAKFHYGGDPRGNYGSDYVFKFDSIDDVYSALLPCWYGQPDSE